MPAIFISYRRDDGLGVGRLADALAEDFGDDVFFDTESIEPGDPFPDRIGGALDGCRVALVSIGKEWDLPRNLERLRDPSDWVRKEIEAALGRQTVRVVPVLLDRSAFPAENELPESLRPLLQRNAITLSQTSWRSGLESLLAKLKTWLSGQAYAAARRDVLPPVLPHLCDRTAQEERLAEIFMEGDLATKAPVIVLHGHKWEEHTGFVDRLRYQRLIDDVLGGRDRGVAVEPLQWNPERAAQGEYGKVLGAAIRRNVLKSLMASEQDVRAYLQGVRQPHCLVMQVTPEDCTRCGDGLIPGLVGAWQALFQALPGGPAIDPSYPIVLWINVSYEDPRQPLPLETLLAPMKTAARALPMLEPVRAGDVEAWMSLDEVKRYVDGHQPGIRALLDDATQGPEKGRMYMSRFVQGVHALLAAAGGRGRDT